MLLAYESFPDPPMPSAWQLELAQSFTHPRALLAFLDLVPEDVGLAQEASRNFPFRVTRPYAGRIRHGDPHDPLLRQVLPIAAELEETPGYGTDPVGDLLSTVQPGLLHKYTGRVLLISTGACAIHCRYCFRRDFPYADLQLSRTGEQSMLAAVAGNHSIREVILSGGDPLALHDDRLKSLVQGIEAIPHVERLRFHSRIPVVLPSRVQEGFAAMLAASRLRKVMVIHANHARELDDAVKEALQELIRNGYTLLNQAVLLKGVNDDADTLADLSEKLFDYGVLPYYLHMLDKARGTRHFAVPDGTARSLMAALRNRLPGYLVPRLVRESPGEPSKSPL